MSDIVEVHRDFLLLLLIYFAINLTTRAKSWELITFPLASKSYNVYNSRLGHNNQRIRSPRKWQQWPSCRREEPRFPRPASSWSPPGLVSLRKKTKQTWFPSWYICPLFKPQSTILPLNFCRVCARCEETITACYHDNNHRFPVITLWTLPVQHCSVSISLRFGKWHVIHLFSRLDVNKIFDPQWSNKSRFVEYILYCRIGIS